MLEKDSPLVISLQNLVEDVGQYLHNISVSDYTQPLDLLSSATIGQHTRHFIEFFTCLYQQYTHGGKCIDYGARERNLKIETDPVHAFSILSTTVGSIISQRSQWDELITTRHDSDFPSDLMPSSYGRELLYAMEHCIHHLAIIKIGINALDTTIDLPPNFGVAPSTVKHRERSCVQ